MKLFKFSSATLLVVALFTAAPLFGQAGTGFSGIGVTNATGPQLSTTLQWYVIPPTSLTPVVTYVNATTDTNSAVAFRYPVGEPISPTTAGMLGTNAMTVGSTNGLNTNDVYIFERSGTFQRLTPASFSTGLITFRENLTTAISTGNKLHRADLRGKIPGGLVQVGTGQPLFVGRASYPALVEVTGAASPTLNAVTGAYGFHQP